MWLDNFSKIFSKSVPSLQGGVFSQCLWTGVALFTHPDVTIDDTIKYDEHQVIPAMPDNMFIHQDTVSDTIQFMVEEGCEYFAKSLVYEYSVNNVPLKVDTKRYPSMIGTMANIANSFDLVYPADLYDINIGSNIGLVSIIRKLYNEHGMGSGDCTRYLTLNVDENIYYRILKVIFVYIYIFAHITLYIFDMIFIYL